MSDVIEAFFNRLNRRAIKSCSVQVAPPFRQYRDKHKTQTLVSQSTKSSTIFIAVTYSSRIATFHCNQYNCTILDTPYNHIYFYTWYSFAGRFSVLLWLCADLLFLRSTFDFGFSTIKHIQLKYYYYYQEPKVGQLIVSE